VADDSDDWVEESSVDIAHRDFPFSRQIGVSVAG
jgi:hypothetical protein